MTSDRYVAQQGISMDTQAVSSLTASHSRTNYNKRVFYGRIKWKYTKK